MFTITIPFKDIKAVGFKLPGKERKEFKAFLERIHAPDLRGGELVIEKRQEGDDGK